MQSKRALQWGFCTLQLRQRRRSTPAEHIACLPKTPAICSHSLCSLPAHAGQIGYAICPMIARGAMLGPDQQVVLHMLDIEPAKQASKRPLLAPP